MPIPGHTKRPFRQTFCHRAPPTPEVGEACRLQRKNHGGREATRTSSEAKSQVAALEAVSLAPHSFAFFANAWADVEPSREETFLPRSAGAHHHRAVPQITPITYRLLPGLACQESSRFDHQNLRRTEGVGHPPRSLAETRNMRAKSLFSNILHISPLNSDIWREIFANSMILKIK
jgi:hypothetical protein